MNKTVKYIIASVTAFLLLILLLCLSFFSHRIKPNDPTTLGNTAGNLMNGGLFCEYEGDLYFSNGYDNGSLYKISGKDGSFKRLNANNCYSINVAGDYVYFCMTGNENKKKGLGSVVRNKGVYRSQSDGKSLLCLNTVPSIAMQLYGNDLYYQQTTSAGTILMKQSIDKKKKDVLSEDLINPVSIVNGTIYYNGTTDNHYLYGMDTISGKASLLWSENVWNPIFHNDGYLYYISMDGKYNLCRHSLSGEGIEVLCKDRVDCFNVSGNIIYYAVSAGDAPALKRMYTDGSANEVVKEGIYHNINITSSNVYFTPYDSSIPMYVQSTYGPVSVTDFAQAAAAALQENKP